MLKKAVSHDINQRMGETPFPPLSQDRGPHAAIFGARSVCMVTGDSVEDKEHPLKFDVPNPSIAVAQPKKASLLEDQDNGPQQSFVSFEETNLPRYTIGLPISTISNTSLLLTQNNLFVCQSFSAQANGIFTDSGTDTVSIKSALAGAILATAQRDYKDSVQQSTSTSWRLAAFASVVARFSTQFNFGKTSKNAT